MRVQLLVLAALLFLLVEAAPGCSADQLVGTLSVVTDGGDNEDGGGPDGDEDGGDDGDEDGGRRDGGGDNLRAFRLRRE